jgi:hypothetical protein
MNRTEFWQVIQRSFDQCGGDIDEQDSTLKDELQPLSAEEIISFNNHFYALVREAHSWDLWGAAYIIGGGCSNDGFEYFRRWLISRGQAWYERALKNPDDLADYPGDIAEGGSEFEEFAYVARAVYEEKFGEFPHAEHVPYGEPKGTAWEDDEEVFKARWPRLFAKYC